MVELFFQTIPTKNLMFEIKLLHFLNFGIFLGFQTIYQGLLQTISQPFVHGCLQTVRLLDKHIVHFMTLNSLFEKKNVQTQRTQLCRLITCVCVIVK